MYIDDPQSKPEVCVLGERVCQGGKSVTLMTFMDSLGGGVSEFCS